MKPTASQRLVLWRLAEDGWELGHGGGSESRIWMQKGGLGRGGETETLSVVTWELLLKRGWIEGEKGLGTGPGLSKRYRITDKGRRALTPEGDGEPEPERKKKKALDTYGWLMQGERPAIQRVIAATSRAAAARALGVSDRDLATWGTSFRCEEAMREPGRVFRRPESTDGPWVPEPAPEAT